MGLDLKLAKRAPKTAQSPNAPGASSAARGDQFSGIRGLFKARFTSFMD